MPNAIQSELILKWHGRGSRAGEIADLLKLPEALVQSVIDNPPRRTKTDSKCSSSNSQLSTDCDDGRT